MTTDVMAGRDEILAAVAGQRAEIEQLLIELVAAPTLLGDELPGQLVRSRHSGCRPGCSRLTPTRSPSTRSRLRSAGT
jgi:hypothetical protein